MECRRQLRGGTIFRPAASPPVARPPSLCLPRLPPRLNASVPFFLRSRSCINDPSQDHKIVSETIRTSCEFGSTKTEVPIGSVINPYTLQSGYWLVGIVDWPAGPVYRESPENPVL